VKSAGTVRTGGFVSTGGVEGVNRKAWVSLLMRPVPTIWPDALTAVAWTRTQPAAGETRSFRSTIELPSWTKACVWLETVPA
jgi:hypothetical protein